MWTLPNKVGGNRESPPTYHYSGADWEWRSRVPGIPGWVHQGLSGTQRCRWWIIVIQSGLSGADHSLPTERRNFCGVGKEADSAGIWILQGADGSPQNTVQGHWRNRTTRWLSYIIKIKKQNNAQPVGNYLDWMPCIKLEYWFYMTKEAFTKSRTWNPSQGAGKPPAVNANLKL